MLVQVLFGVVFELLVMARARVFFFFSADGRVLGRCSLGAGVGAVFGVLFGACLRD